MREFSLRLRKFYFQADFVFLDCYFASHIRTVKIPKIKFHRKTHVTLTQPINPRYYFFIRGAGEEGSRSGKFFCKFRQELSEVHRAKGGPPACSSIQSLNVYF